MVVVVNFLLRYKITAMVNRISAAPLTKMPEIVYGSGGPTSRILSRGVFVILVKFVCCSAYKGKYNEDSSK